MCVFYNLCEEKNLSVLSLVAEFFLDKLQTRARKVSQKCWHKPSETKLVHKERKNLRKHLRSQKREKSNREKVNFGFKKNSKTSPQFLSSRWSGF